MIFPSLTAMVVENIDFFSQIYSVSIMGEIIKKPKRIEFNSKLKMNFLLNDLVDEMYLIYL
jgi:hypothetical protein